MSGGDDWAPGDLALCVRETTGSIPSTWEPSVGGVYRVVEISDGATAGEIVLDLAEDPDRNDEAGWEADAFRKIKPLSDEERDEFLADLRTPAKHTT
jgi:hypothetical protein